MSTALHGRLVRLERQTPATIGRFILIDRVAPVTMLAEHGIIVGANDMLLTEEYTQHGVEVIVSTIRHEDALSLLDPEVVT